MPSVSAFIGGIIQGRIVYKSASGIIYRKRIIIKNPGFHNKSGCRAISFRCLVALFANLSSRIRGFKNWLVVRPVHNAFLATEQNGTRHKRTTDLSCKTHPNASRTGKRKHEKARALSLSLFVILTQLHARRTELSSVCGAHTRMRSG